MLFSNKTGHQKRESLRKALETGKLLRFVGSFSPFVSLIIERSGFDGVYISGACIANDLGWPDIGLTTETEVLQRGNTVARVSHLPAIIDIDTGFGGPINVARTIQDMDDSGICGCHLEDQASPKRCGHLDSKVLVEIPEMVQKIKAALSARRDKNFLLIARTDARTVDGLDKAINRAKAYVDAGAEMIFPEALQTQEEFQKFRSAIDVPLIANMTEFGKSPLVNCRDLQRWGYNMVIYPVTAFRMAMKAVEAGLAKIRDEGTQEHLLEEMMTRKHLYELLRYQDYSKFDDNIFNFTI